jgi:CDGSH-type Zn-finger protein
MSTPSSRQRCLVCQAPIPAGEEAWEDDLISEMFPEYFCGGCKNRIDEVSAAGSVSQTWSDSRRLKSMSSDRCPCGAVTNKRFLDGRHRCPSSNTQYIRQQVGGRKIVTAVTTEDT